MNNSLSEEERCLEIILHIDRQRKISTVIGSLNAILFSVILLFALLIMLIANPLINGFGLVGVILGLALYVIVLFVIKYSSTKRELDLEGPLQRYCLSENIPEELRKIAQSLLEERRKPEISMRGENIYNK